MAANNTFECDACFACAPQRGRYISMKLSVFLIFLPVLSIADCQIELQEIKPTVAESLHALFEKENSKITEGEFVQAEAAVSSIIEAIQLCADYHQEYEYEHYDYTRCGEKAIDIAAMRCGLVV